MGPEHLVLGIMILALGLYAVLGGADFGAGVWEFTTFLQAEPDERKLTSEAIGPVWEANHVWLIFVLIILFNGFPLAFAAISRALWLPLLLALAGIVFRGAGFIFRAYGEAADWLRRSAGAAFALASTATPFFLGMSVGALAGGKLRIAESGHFHGDHLADWLTPLAIYSGILATGMCAFLAAVYLTREAHIRAPELLRLWRGRALASGIWIGILAALGLLMCALEAPELWTGLMQRGWPLVAVSIVSGLSSLAALRTNRYFLATILVAAAVATVVGGWALGQYPYLAPPRLTVEVSKAPDVVLWAMAACILSGSVILFPALWWLFRIFKAEVRN